MKIYLAIFLLFVTVWCQNGEEIDITEVSNDQGFKCKKDKPTLSVGDMYINSTFGLADAQKVHETFILGVSNSQCVDCCKGEIILQQIMRLFDNKHIQYKNGSIPIVRLDYNTHSEMLKMHNITLEGVPRMFVYHKKEYHTYDEGDHLNYFLSWLNKVLHPIAELDSKLAISLFINPNVEFIEDTPLYNGNYRTIDELFTRFSKVTRVVAFVDNMKGYKKKVRKLERAARSLAGRSDLRVAIVTDKAIIDDYKKQYDARWFEPTSRNTVVLFTKNSDLSMPQTFYNLEADNHNFESWLNFVSLDSIEKFSPQAYQIVNYIDMPIFMLFLQPNFTEDAHSIEVFKVLQEIAFEYPAIMQMYTDDDFYYYMKQQVSIRWDDMPALGLLNNEGMVPIVFPKGQKMTKDNLKKFFDGFMDGTILAKEFTFPDLNTDFSQHMPNCIQITDDSYDSILLNQDLDHMLLIYNSSESLFANIESMNIMGFVASVLKDIGATTVQIAYLDIDKYNLPKELTIEEPQYPELMFLQAGKKTSPPHELVRDFAIPKIVEYIRNNAKTDVKAAFKVLDEEIQKEIGQNQGEQEQDMISDDL